MYALLLASGHNFLRPRRGRMQLLDLPRDVLASPSHVCPHGRARSGCSPRPGMQLSFVLQGKLTILLFWFTAPRCLFFTLNLLNCMS